MPVTRLIRLLLSMLGLMIGFSACAADDLTFSNKWRIECSGNAESSGAIEFRVTPRGGKPTAVTVQIEDGRSENGVARNIRDAFRTQLPPGTYDVETDDGEDVLLNRNFNEPNFALELLSSTVEDVRIELETE